MKKIIMYLLVILMLSTLVVNAQHRGGSPSHFGGTTHFNGVSRNFGSHPQIQPRSTQKISPRVSYRPSYELRNRFYYGPRNWSNRGWWGYRNGYWLNSGLYTSLYLSRIGLSIGYLPAGYYPFYWDNYEYFYSDGYYYQYNNNQYTVVEPPLGAEINNLPNGAVKVNINGEEYYELNGVYYQQIQNGDKSTYVISGKDGKIDANLSSNNDINIYKIGDVLKDLPQDSRKLKIDDKIYYVSPNDIYFEKDNINGEIIYKVVGTP